MILKFIRMAFNVFNSYLFTGCGEVKWLHETVKALRTGIAGGK